MKRWLALLPLFFVLPVAAQEKLSHGRFDDVAIYRPAGEVRQFVLFLSGDGGWDDEVEAIARQLAGHGAMVAGIDTPRLYATLELDGAGCVFPSGDLENLAHYVQGYARLPTYHTPLLVGYSSGATLAYAMNLQAPTGTFMGAMSLGFCVDLDLVKPLCPGAGLQTAPRQGAKSVDLLPTKKPLDWALLHGARDPVCPVAPARAFAAQVPGARFIELPKLGHDYPASGAWLAPFLAAYDAIAARSASALPPPPVNLADLPLVEVRAAQPGPTFAVLLSGDGGWAGLDKNVAAALAAKGVDVVGIDSLRYFWSRRTPQGLAADLDRVVRYYEKHWRKSGVILGGYSQGADVLPFAINRLPPASLRLVTHAVLMGLGAKASFEFHVGNWLGSNDDTALPIAPEALRLPRGKTLCLYGADEKDSLCPQLAPDSVEARALPGGHHFDGAYGELAALILEYVR